MGAAPCSQRPLPRWPWTSRSGGDNGKGCRRGGTSLRAGPGGRARSARLASAVFGKFAGRAGSGERLRQRTGRRRGQRCTKFPAGRRRRAASNALSSLLPPLPLPRRTAPPVPPQTWPSTRPWLFWPPPVAESDSQAQRPRTSYRSPTTRRWDLPPGSSTRGAARCRHTPRGGCRRLTPAWG